MLIGNTSGAPLLLLQLQPGGERDKSRLKYRNSRFPSAILSFSYISSLIMISKIDVCSAIPFNLEPVLFPAFHKGKSPEWDEYSTFFKSNKGCCTEAVAQGHTANMLNVKLAENTRKEALFTRHRETCLSENCVGSFHLVAAGHGSSQPQAPRQIFM